jgi:hypothetical protein
MPLYVFEHPETKEKVEVIQKMNEDHSYVDKNGVKWNRVFQIPNASIDTGVDGSKESFMNYTANKKGTIGDLWDASREASEKRVKQHGYDPVKKEHFQKFEKEKGIKHTHDK